MSEPVSEPVSDPDAEARHEARVSALHAIRTLDGRVDQHFRLAVAQQPRAFTCAEGCSECCHARFSVFEVEAVAIRSALADIAAKDPPLRARLRAQASAASAQTHCALLVDGRCSVYEARPIICRSQGLALRPTPTAEIDHCPLNFTDEAPQGAGVLALDRINAALSVMAQMYEPTAQRVELADLAAENASSLT